MCANRHCLDATEFFIFADFFFLRGCPCMLIMVKLRRKFRSTSVDFMSYFEKVPHFNFSGYYNFFGHLESLSEVKSVAMR